MANSCRIKIVGRSLFSGKFKETIELKKALEAKKNVINNSFKNISVSKHLTMLAKRKDDFGARAANKLASMANTAKDIENAITNPMTNTIEESVVGAKIIGLSKTASVANQQWCFIYAAYFQRLVSRTPLDEDYEYTLGNGSKRKHTKDNDVTRNDWVMYVNGSPIKSTDFPASFFYKFNDRGAIDAIEKKIETAVGVGNILHSVSVENKNWKYSILEEGKYPGKGGDINQGKLYPHGTKNGFSVQAPYGIKSVSDKELKMVASKSNQFFRTYMGKTSFEKIPDMTSFRGIRARYKKKTYSDMDLDDENIKRLIRVYEKIDKRKTEELFSKLFDVYPTAIDKQESLWKNVKLARRQRNFYGNQKDLKSRLKQRLSILPDKLYGLTDTESKENESAFNKKYKTYVKELKKIKQERKALKRDFEQKERDRFLRHALGDNKLSLTRKDVIKRDVERANRAKRLRKAKEGRLLYLAKHNIENITTSASGLKKKQKVEIAQTRRTKKLTAQELLDRKTKRLATEYNTILRGVARSTERDIKKTELNKMLKKKKKKD